MQRDDVMIMFLLHWPSAFTGWLVSMITWRATCLPYSLRLPLIAQRRQHAPPIYQALHEWNGNIHTPSSRPDIFAHTLDPVAELVDARIPLLQPAPHALDLLHIQNLWLYPVDPCDLGNLINLTP